MMGRKKLGFALGSGGSRGVAHVGFLQAMEENGIIPDYITGSSMGSVVGAAYAFGLSPRDIFKEAALLKPMDILQWSASPNGFFSSGKLRKLLKRHLGEVSFEDLKIPFACVAVELCSQRLVSFQSGSVLDAVVASSSIPTVFTPFEKEGKKYVDGGVFERVPARLLKDMGADKIVAVDVLGQKQCGGKKKNVLEALFETIDLMDNFRTRKSREENGKIIDLWIEPALGDMNQYSFKRTDFAYVRGYQAGMEYAPQIKALI